MQVQRDPAGRPDLRAQPHHFGDREFDEATDALIGSRSVAALLAAHESHKARRASRPATARRARWRRRAELAPVFGLAGTLISLSQLPADGHRPRRLCRARSRMAVLTTLYGLLLANLLLAPLARVIERAARGRRGERAEDDRLAGRRRSRPRTAPRPQRRAVGHAA